MAELPYWLGEQEKRASCGAASLKYALCVLGLSRTEKHIRRSMGFGVIRARRLDRTLPYASMASLGYFSIPLFVAGRTLHSWRNCIRGARAYGVKWYELPTAFGLAAAACAMEIPGMIHAVRGEPLDKTAYR